MRTIAIRFRGWCKSCCLAILLGSLIVGCQTNETLQRTLTEAKARVAEDHPVVEAEVVAGCRAAAANVAAEHGVQFGVTPTATIYRADVYSSFNPEDEIDEILIRDAGLISHFLEVSDYINRRVGL